MDVAPVRCARVISNRVPYAGAPLAVARTPSDWREAGALVEWWHVLGPRAFCSGWSTRDTTPRTVGSRRKIHAIFDK